MKILTVVGTRPNFIKVTQFRKHFEHAGFNLKIVHTVQHYDHKMSKVFFEQFELKPDFWLNITAESPNTQMAKIMLGLEKLINNQFKPDLIIVVGDVNSTFAAALTANKMNIPLAHLEAGLRSKDLGMPEEINRILTDKITDYFFVTEQSGYDYLVAEGKKKENIFFVGNTMIDTMVAFEEKIKNSTVLEEFDVKEGDFVLMTMHRPATVDNEKRLKLLLEAINTVVAKFPIIFPIHPRTLMRFKQFGLSDAVKGIQGLVLTPPLDYFSCQKLIATAKFILTDSGGIQEESTFRKIPCLTLRPNTERPSTITIGSNTLINLEMEVLKLKMEEVSTGTYKIGQVPPLWDGNSTERIVKVLQESFGPILSN